MMCPNCGSENVTIEIQQATTYTKKHGNGIGGHLNNAARGLTAFCTLGLSACLILFGKRARGTKRLSLKTKRFASAKTAVIPGLLSN